MFPLFACQKIREHQVLDFFCDQQLLVSIPLHHVTSVFWKFKAVYLVPSTIILDAFCDLLTWESWDITKFARHPCRGADSAAQPLLELGGPVWPP